MKTKELSCTQTYGIEAANVCEDCCRMLVIPKNKLLEYLQDSSHVFGEIMLLVGKFFACILMGMQFAIEAIFPHLSRKKTPYELEYERYQKEWEEKTEARAQLDLENRFRADANEEAEYINSLKVRYQHPKDEYFDAGLTEQRNRIVDLANKGSSADAGLDRVTLRKYAVDIEQLRLHEIKQNARRSQLQSEHTYHIKEMDAWSDRAYAASDSKEKRRCEREMEVHKYKAYYAKIAYENI